MASTTQVKRFVAIWLQLGKRLVHSSGDVQEKPDRVVQGDRYSPEFDSCWATLLDQASNWHLSGTAYTLAMLLTQDWEIVSCARCDLPIPLQIAGINDPSCPCGDIEGWPNLDLPLPHTPIDSRHRLASILCKLDQLDEAQFQKLAERYAVAS
ncbi:hypothetical protein [Lyngbya confervoides]|uniref:Uncharacterized protein n=1 Tax=Lyngbya confervoides BDU141951 TaxID=1574623 RepID=A0ABD4T5J3_9CYAN|nr:hypothetical protein [Lyngbya confervoides]MCM1983517.1 hypothetical protein [Lyngbya confervoides BDU141951]